MMCAMGGRKDDVIRMQKQHKKRPLSAVIEELEADDLDLKTPTSTSTTTTTTNNNNNDSNFTNSNDVRHDVNSTEDPGADGRTSDGVGEKNLRQTSKASAVCSISPSPTLPTVVVTNDIGNSNSIANPNTPRRNSLRSGRRSALTPAFSPKLGRRGSFGLTSRLGSLSDVTDSDDDTLLPSDMTRLRQTADRLHLSTRRPSVMQWRAQYVECPAFPVLNSGNGDVTELNDGEDENRWTAERTQRINTALDWIKNELLEMRTQDQQLARQLLTIRSDLHQLKLARSCEEHQDMLDDVQSELEELQEFADVLDLPVPTITDSPLKHLGVTRMNFSARRFSTC